MKNEVARREIEFLDYYLQNHSDDYSEGSHTAMMMARDALKQESCEDCISRQAVDELSKELVHTTRDKADFLCNFWEKLQKLPPVTPTQKWISVSEGLPKEEKKSYWICTDCGHQCECRWTNVNPFWTDLTTDWHWHIADVPQYNKVVAWMPLPEPYKAESEEKE